MEGQLGAGELPAAVVDRLRTLAAAYSPPDFAHVPDPDSALFLCAVDHKAGYAEEHLVERRGPFRGSALMWEAGLAAARREPGLLSARRLREVSGQEIKRWFSVDGDTVADPERRAGLWRDLAAGLWHDHGGSTAALLAASDGELAGVGGLLSLLARYEAYADPLAKKGFLFAKIAERRGWLEVADPESWQVSADSVLMRVALRSGLVAPGDLDEVRAATRGRLRQLALAAAVPVPVLDDLIWERGREDPDLLGREAGDLREPRRAPGSAWF